MPRAEAIAVVPADATAVYAILADYRVHHPRILPKPEFERLDVLDGGVGAGTRIRVAMRVFGRSSELTMAVTEPEPGRVLEERDEATGVVTRFEVDPVSRGASSVRIVTQWPRAASVGKRVEAWLVARVARKLYARELAQLRAYAPEADVKPR